MHSRSTCHGLRIAIFSCFVSDGGGCGRLGRCIRRSAAGFQGVNSSRSRVGFLACRLLLERRRTRPIYALFPCWGL